MIENLDLLVDLEDLVLKAEAKEDSNYGAPNFQRKTTRGRIARQTNRK